MTDLPEEFHDAVNVVFVSGGKDSTAMYLLAMEQGIDFLPVFADVGNEHEHTYQFVRELPTKSGGPNIVWVKADFTGKFDKAKKDMAAKWVKDGIPQERIDEALAAMVPTGNPFVDMCLLRHGFPSVRHRFCTDLLKIAPTQQNVLKPIAMRGHKIIQWRGVRRDESLNRRKTKTYDTMHDLAPNWLKESCRLYHPLAEWTLPDVWKMHKKHNIEPNPLYRQGFTRVGCFPCIMSSAAELKAIAKWYPEHIDRIEQWERILYPARKNAVPTFLPGVAIDRLLRQSKDYSLEKHGIRAHAEHRAPKDQMELIPLEEVREPMQSNCSDWGVCE